MRAVREGEVGDGPPLGVSEEIKRANLLLSRSTFGPT
jgi:hypothetical protein